MLTSSNAGSSDTDENELAVKPSGLPSSLAVVTIVTPVMNAPNASRNSRVLILAACWLATWLVCWLISHFHFTVFGLRLRLQPGTQRAIDFVGRGQVHHVALVFDHDRLAVDGGFCHLLRHRRRRVGIVR